MFTISETASHELEAYFADKEKTPIRVYLAAGGSSGPRLALALDEPTPEDKVFEQDGFTFCIAGDLLETVGGVSIDLTYMGFSVEPEIPLANTGGSSCGGSCSSGSRGTH